MVSCTVKPLSGNSRRSLASALFQARQKIVDVSGDTSSLGHDEETPHGADQTSRSSSR